MRLTLDVSKTLQQNAALYFEKAKRSRKKAAGARAAAERFRNALQELEQKQEAQKKEVKKKVVREKQWFEKFRWFRSSDGFLCIGGRDATTNEMLIKKYAIAGDLVFHTGMAGSPFFIVKAEGKPVPEQTIRETADATATFSRAWKLGLAAADVYWVKPEQVTKEARAGEYLTKGAFVIKGRTNRVPNEANLAVGLTTDGLVMAGPRSAVKKHCAKNVEIIQGNEKPSDVAKQVAKVLGAEIDDVLRVLPAGNARVKRV